MKSLIVGDRVASASPPVALRCARPARSSRRARGEPRSGITAVLASFGSSARSWRRAWASWRSRMTVGAIVAADRHRRAAITVIAAAGRDAADANHRRLAPCCRRSSGLLTSAITRGVGGEPDAAVGVVGRELRDRCAYCRRRVLREPRARRDRVLALVGVGARAGRRAPSRARPASPSRRERERGLAAPRVTPCRPTTRARNARAFGSPCAARISAAATARAASCCESSPSSASVPRASPSCDQAAGRAAPLLASVRRARRGCRRAPGARPRRRRLRASAVAAVSRMPRSLDGALEDRERVLVAEAVELAASSTSNASPLSSSAARTLGAASGSFERGERARGLDAELGRARSAT